MPLGGMYYADPKKKNNYVGKILMAAMLTALCILMLKQSQNFNNTPTIFSRHEPGVTHVLVTGGAGYIGSHAALRLLKDSYRVTIVDNLSRGNLGAVRILQELFPEPGRFQFNMLTWEMPKWYTAVHNIFSQNAFDAVMHFAAVAYVGESTLGPLKYFIVIGSDPNGRLGEAPRPELREHGRISGACFDAARGITPGLKLMVRGTDYKTADGTCIRDYIDVTDLVDAHVKALEKARPGKVGIYNVGTGRGRSVKEFVEVCKAATRVPIKVDFLPRRPGDYAEVYSDPTKIQNELNWTAKYTDLQESVQIAWRWQKSHGKGYGSSVATS
ncbi:hypothetical protein P3S68_028019 [Capsicum galapagoense]